MRENYRKVNTCFNCKYVVLDADTYYCNVDYTYHNIIVTGDYYKIYNWKFARELEFNTICDQHKKGEML